MKKILLALACAFLLSGCLAHNEIDEPKDNTVCYRDFRYANELVKFIKATTNLSVAVAGYPEGHPESESLN